MSFSILILTKNEALNLEACLDSVAWCDDVAVLDSYSTDGTCALAEQRGIRVAQRAFDDFGSQRNYGLETIPWKHDWVFHLDADERFNETLRAECEAAIAEDRHSGYFVANRIIFLGRWIRRSTQYPHPQVRLIKRGEIHFAKAGHGQREEGAERGLGHLKTAYDHFNFSKGIRDWVDKHNRYSGEEAALALETFNEPLRASEMLAGDRMVRRRAMKRLHARLPGRWGIKFCWLYVARLGFLDGYPGFVYCLLQAFYDFLITIKIREAREGRPSSGV